MAGATFQERLPGELATKICKRCSVSLPIAIFPHYKHGKGGTRIRYANYCPRRAVEIKESEARDRGRRKTTAISHPTSPAKPEVYEPSSFTVIVQRLQERGLVLGCAP